jgi:soluble lytic murein transglycosylase-like protein
MFFRITDTSFARLAGSPVPPGAAADWNGVATPGEIGRPDDLPVPVGQQLRRWAALLALAGLALPGAGAARAASGWPPAGPVIGASPAATAGRSGVSPGHGAAPGSGDPGSLPSGDAGDDTAPATAAPWEAGVVEADGKPLPSAPPPGPVPVDGIPQPAAAPVTATTAPVPAAPKVGPGPGETARAVTNQSVPATKPRADDIVPDTREYLRPILVRYAQENGLPADLVMSLAWVESSWRRTAESDVGAIGVMQLMPDTVEYVSKTLLGLHTNLDPRNATSNVRMGTKYLRHLVNEYRGNVRQALIAYNQGLTSLSTRGSFGVAERYADRVLAVRSQFRLA